MNKNRALQLNCLDDGTFIQDSRDIRVVCESVGISMDELGITGAVVYLDESGADYKMIYLTESRAPHAFDAVYYPLPFYREGAYNPNMPVYWKWYIYF